MVINGQVQPASGTSAPAPLFAGLVSLLNEARLQAGKPPMGLLNPFLYANPGAFTDVTVGTNAISEDGPLDDGFSCTEGYDPVSGLGTPIFNKLLSAAMAAVSAPATEFVV